jgi:hypothetical protein
MRDDMESCDQSGEDRDEAWLHGPVASVKGKSEALKRGTVCDSEAWARLSVDGLRQW